MSAPDFAHADHKFDFIIVGSGAGGGPLAARLAEKKFRVLLIEAGPEQSATDTPVREVSLVPGLHAVSTEHPGLSWEFFVEHYDHPLGEDPKRHKTPGDPLRDGIFYPRAAGLGGCTVHNAMITVAGPDSDWEDLADFVEDDTWRGGPMREYFKRLERNEYRPQPTSPPTSWLGRAWDLIWWLVGRPTDHASGRHGFKGWLHTSVTDIAIGLSDRQLINMLKAALWQSRKARLDRAWTWVSTFLRGRTFEKLDPNHARTQREHPEGVISVPLAVCGPRTTIHQNSETPFVMRGRRSSPRELLLETRATHPEYLEIWTNTFVTNVVFDNAETPRAIGVQYLHGERLYKAHPDYSRTAGTPGRVLVKPEGEVILCGGSFNTPQLLMLSGIGDAPELKKFAGDTACVLKGADGKPIAGANGQVRRIDLPGVGRNLQDRYEVTVISKMKRDFSLLEGGTFRLPDGTTPPDKFMKEWRAEGTGLYTSNGSVLGILKRSRPDLAQPDLFMFGLPLPFRGYEIDYSKVGDQHDKFTWAILKGHTRNGDGTVGLRSIDPLDPPLVNFHYFNETSRPGESANDPDLAALVEGVKFVRGIAKLASGWLLGRAVTSELHPGLALVPDGTDAEAEARMKDWIRRDAWGHHACGTCRMGPAKDALAVLDSHFRVRHVEGLRVVDASIFPRIPGYFIVTNVYMASEKAADVIAEDKVHRASSETYPRDLRAMEAAAVDARRKLVSLDPLVDPDPLDPSTYMPSPLVIPDPKDPRKLIPSINGDGDWNRDVAGLALSGGGVRSATFNLGVLQAFARQRWLRRVDFLSTVSGGGYIGSFIGRAYDRLRHAKWGGAREPRQSAPDRVERELNDADSPVVQWLRANGNYIAPAGAGDARVNTATFIRNFLSLHFVVGTLVFTLFGLANYFRYRVLSPTSAGLGLLAMNQTQLPLGSLLRGFLGPFFSPWFSLFELVLLFMIVPLMVGYWIVSQDRHGRYSRPSLALMFVCVGALLYVAISDGFNLPVFAIAVAPLVAFLHVELAWRRGRRREEAIGRGGVETQRLRTRNYLTYDLGAALALAGGALAFAVIDSIAHGLHQHVVAQNRVYTMAFASFIALGTTLAPIARYLAGLFNQDKKSGPPSTIDRIIRKQATAGALAAVLLFVPLVFMSFLSHAAYGGGTTIVAGLEATGLTLILSLVLALPTAIVFVNRSSLTQVYAARLARAYLGASNPLRFRPEGRNVTEVMAGDDVPAIQNYRPYESGGPLHLLNVTVNQTVDFTSQRGNRDRKGENMAVSALGLTVGQRWHGAWSRLPEDQPANAPVKVPTSVTPVGHIPGTDHPLIDQIGEPTKSAEMLSLRQWMAISGAALAPARGQATELGTALLFGLANLRTGYWWNSGITEAARDGFPALSALARLVYVLESLFATQTLLLYEWVARYPGPWEQYWYLSDGGFFETTGAYELIRRRLPRIILCDASEDPTYEFGSFANLMRKVRIDFEAEIEPFEDSDYASIPAAVIERLGSLDDLAPARDADGNIVGPSRRHAALFWVRYATAPSRPSVLLYIKAGLTGDESLDVKQYHGKYQEFPHEGTADQFFEEAQWESYRNLGEHVAATLVEHGPWLWNIPLTGDPL